VRVTSKTKVQGNTTTNPDGLEAAAPPIGQSSKNGMEDITFTDDGWRGWAAAFGAKGDGVAYVNDSKSVCLALAPALFVARKETKGEARRIARRVHDLVLSETLGMSLTPEFHCGEERATWNPTSDAILLLRVLDVFAYDPTYWWERDLALDVLRELGVDFGGLDLAALGISANAARDAMLAVMERRVEISFQQGQQSGNGANEKIAEATSG